MDEQSDLVDQFYRPFIRSLGNLVIAFAQSEAALLDLVSEIHNGDEMAAVVVLKAPNAKNQILDSTEQIGLTGFDLDELRRGVNDFWSDKEIRNRLMHDQWYPSIMRGGEVATRGLTRKKSVEIVHRCPAVEDCWALVRRFQHYDDIFSFRAHMLRKARSH